MFKKHLYEIQAHNSMCERDPCHIQITPQHNSLKTRITPKSQVSYRNQISNLQTQHIFTSQSCSCVAKRNSTVMVIITLETILNEKVAYHFCQLVLLF